jgi:hypothetical protein
MFDERHYVPVLKWKRGEQRALRELENDVRGAITPLLEMSFNPDLETGEPPRPPGELIENAIDKMCESWLKQHRFFLDAGMFATLAEATGTALLFDAARARDLPFVPVVALSQPVGDVTAAIGCGAAGACIRIPFAESGDALPEQLLAFVAERKLPPENIDLILDLGALLTDSAGAAVMLARAFVSAVPDIERWRTVTLLATSFPEHMGSVPANGELVAPRTEWLTWMRLSQEAKLKRMPSFGDYAIQHPDGPEDYDPRKMPMSACIRYTCEREWLFIKGVTTKLSSPAEQFPGLAQRLTMHARFCGDEHCRGCGDAAACAQGAPRLGNPEQWRRIGTVHHLTMVVRQLSALQPRA